MMNPYQQQVLFVENEFENFSIPALVTESGQNVLAGVPQMALEWIQYSAKRDLGKFSNILLRISRDGHVQVNFDVFGGFSNIHI